jgi:hypothetical protein
MMEKQGNRGNMLNKEMWLLFAVKLALELPEMGLIVACSAPNICKCFSRFRSVIYWLNQEELWRNRRPTNQKGGVDKFEGDSWLV